MRRSMGALCTLTLLSLAVQSTLAAGVFRITNRTYGNLTDPALTSQIDQLFNTMETEVNGGLGQFDAGSYLTGTANATALASAGGTHDAANRFKYFYLSVGGGLAADLGGKSPHDLFTDPNAIQSAKGLSGNLNMTVGIPGHLLKLPKIGSFQPERFRLFLGYSQFSQSYLDVQFNYSAFSLMGQYQFFSPYASLFGLFKWHGVAVTSGFKYSRIKVLFSKTFNEIITQTLNDPMTGTHQMTMNYSTTAQLGASADITTIPIEASTSVGLLSFLDAYVGLGTDINFGSASSIISAPGSVTANEPSHTLGTMSGDIEFDLGQKSKAQSFSSRYLIGVAFDLRVVSLNLQYNKYLSNPAESAYLSLAFHY